MKYGRYEITRELGKGAMGIVYLAHDPNINRPVALKVLRPDRVTSTDFMQRFLREARAIGRLSHQNIVTVYDVGEDQSTVYIAMEYLEGNSLNIVAKESRLSIQQILDIGSQVAAALDYAHSKGIVHRDIKPQNIILTPNGQIKITDFGIAHIDDPEMSQQTQAGEILGTPNYMSPEQVMGKKVDGRSDLFSLGIILYELATGGRPFKGDNFATIFKSIIDDEPEAPIKGNPELPTDLSDSIMRSLKKEPEKRYQAGGEMVKAFKRIEKGTELPPVMERQVSVNKGNHRAVMLIVLAIIIAVIAAGTVYFVFAARKDRVSVEPAKKETTVITPRQNDQAKEVEKAQGAGETKKEELPTANIPVKESSTPEVNKDEKKIATESKLKKSSTKKAEKASAPNKKESHPKSDTDKIRGTPSAPGASQVDNQKTKHLPRESSPPGKNEPENKFQRMKRLKKEYNETKDPSLLEEIERLKRDFYM